MNDIRDYLDEYLLNTKNRVIEYICTNYHYNMVMFNHYNIVDMYDMYIKGFNEDIVVECIKVLSFNPGDSEPTYYLEDITPNFFLYLMKFMLKLKYI